MATRSARIRAQALRPRVSSPNVIALPVAPPAGAPPGGAAASAWPSRDPATVYMRITAQEVALVKIHRHLSTRGRELLLDAMRLLVIEHAKWLTEEDALSTPGLTSPGGH